MKKRLVYCLALSLILTSISPIAAGAEEDINLGTEISDTVNSSDVSASAEASSELYVNEDVEEATPEEDLILDSTIDVYADGQFDKENSEIADEEMNSNVSIVSVEEVSGTASEEESPEENWTSVEDTSIQYRYDESEKTLYFKTLEDGAVITDYKTGQLTPWKTYLQNNNITDLERIVIGEGIAGIGAYNFYDGSIAPKVYQNLKEVIMPSKIPDNGFSVRNGAFSGAGALTTIDLRNVSSIGNSSFASTALGNVVFECDTISMGFNAFANCKKLTSVSAKEISSMGDSAFENCENLTEFNYDTLENIPDNAFYNTNISSFECKGVKSVGMLAFGTSLKEISFDQTDLSFDSMSFMLSTNLAAVCYPGTKEQWSAIVSEADNISTAAVHCKAEPSPKDATCEEPGLARLVCEVCGEAYTDGTEIPALGHSYAAGYTIDQKATCAKTGEQSRHCTRKGCDSRMDIQTLPVDKSAHVYSEWTTISEATVFAPMQQQRVCSVCGEKETRSVGDKLTATASLNASSVTLKVDQSTSSLKVDLANGDSVTKWKSTNTKIFTVEGNADGTCKLTAKKTGSAKLKITLASGKTKTVKLKVQKAPVTTKKITGLDKKVTLKKGSSIKLKPVLSPITSSQKITYTSSNKKVAKVNKNGKIKGIKKGKAIITVKSGSKTVQVKVTVK